MALDLQAAALAGITAFYAIVNIPNESLPLVFREVERVLQTGGLLLLAFHTGDERIHEEDLWGRPISMDFFLFQPSAIQRLMEAEGLAIEEVIERGPTPRKWNTRVEGHISLRASRVPWHNCKDGLRTLLLIDQIQIGLAAGPSVHDCRQITTKIVGIAGIT